MTRARAADREPQARIAALYTAFSRDQASGRSPLYVEVTAAIAADEQILDFLATMPEPKWQPNLLLAAVRYLYGTPPSAAEFVRCIHIHSTELGEVIATRATQTNEPARCATLLPALARLRQPLALLEVGASAGLCLLPDRYGYDYGAWRIDPTAPGPGGWPTFRCRLSGPIAAPQRGVEVAWRAGLDLRPVDLSDPEEQRWLEALVWPGEEARLPGLRAACELARGDPPLVRTGDLRHDLCDLARQAPPDATLVVFHTAVLIYIRDRVEREEFARSVADLGAVWVANEHPTVVPGLDPESLGPAPRPDALVLCVNGRPLAWTDGHATWMQSLDSPG